MSEGRIDTFSRQLPLPAAGDFAMVLEDHLAQIQRTVLEHVNRAGFHDLHGITLSVSMRFGGQP